MFTTEQVHEVAQWLSDNGSNLVDRFLNDYLPEQDMNVYPTFNDFWELYDKKVGDKSKLEKKWIKLPQKEKYKIMEYLPKYKMITPNKQYRKMPETFLNNKSWNDELIIPKELMNSTDANAFKLMNAI